ncbi:sulfate transporter CysZ [Legionella sp. km772]|uniref:sulfate transporter CysZ n=1 Tax=Legionella sp. km772 TaxID=2498111 RepID=UPI000F8CB858|nr:sulfate transporter CysZ [Legionella sp. km772]RUR12615.1 sulfate transporter CysZ [Legionella sp. km772]
MANFIRGVLFFLAGFKYLGTKGLKRFIILPIGFNFLLFAGLYYLTTHFLLPYGYYYLNQLPAWLNFLSSLLFFFFLLSFLLFFLSTFSVFLNLIAAPFNGLLAEKVQLLFYHSAIPSLAFRTIALRSIKRQVQFLAYFLPRLLLLGVLFFVPFIHPFYPFIWFIFNAWILSLQYQDFAMDNNLIEFDEMRAQLAENKMLTLGFGTGINALIFVPGLNLFIMPVAVISGVILFCEQNKQVLKPIKKV